jgi:iron complex outermembrane receptor protein
MRSLGKLAFAGVSLLALSAPAYAQQEPAADDALGNEDIVVTGTLIRGTAPVGSQTINVDSTAIVEKAAGTTNELLGTIPQLGATFNGRFEIDPRGFSTGTNSINKPNLRNLRVTGSGAVTLVTMDSMRLTPVGVNDSATDVDIIPANILAGIDAVTDGGSSLYGADAVGGVLNFRTLRRYDGIKLDFNYAFGTKIEEYKTWDGSIMAGKSWSNGNAFVSVSHYDRDQVLNADVPWSSGTVYNAAGVPSFASTQCINPVGSKINYFFTGSGWTNNPLAPGAGRVPIGTACDFVASETYSPRTKRTNVFASVSQDFSDSISLRVTGYWAKRDMYFEHYPSGASTADAPAPAVPPPPLPPVGTIVTVQGGTGFSFGANSAYVNRRNAVGFETWGITPELTARLGENWQLRVGMHYGRSTNYNRFEAVNNVLVANYVASGQLNPLNVGAASAAVITDVTNFETANDQNQRMFLARAIVDGSLLTLPAGDVKLAVGVEYQHTEAHFRTALDKIGAIDALPFISKSRNAKSIFGEIQVPVFSFLDLTASGRYDHYNNFGGTFNPNFGATLKPFSWLKIFGHWNSSFNAPTAVDSIGLGSGRLACGIYVPNGQPGSAQRPNDPLGRDTSRQGTCALILTGGRPTGIKPQTADSWAVGFEASPVDGLSFGAEFYSIDFKNVIGALNPANTNTYITNADLYTYNITQAPYETILSQLGNGAAIKAQQPNASSIALVVDSRISNLNASKIQGFDVHVDVKIPTGIGDLGFGANGNVPTRSRVTNNGATTDEIGHIDPEYTFSTYVSLRKDRWSARATVNIRGPFENATVDYLGNKLFADPFIMTNLFIGYSIKDSSGPLNGTSFRLNIDNLFDKEPQRIKLANTNFPSFMNWTLGRVIKLGITKEF